MNEKKKVWCEECQAYHADLTEDDVHQLGKFLLEQLIEECSKRGCGTDAAFKAIGDVYIAALRAELERDEAATVEAVGDFLLRLASSNMPGVQIHPIHLSKEVN